MFHTIPSSLSLSTAAAVLTNMEKRGDGEPVIGRYHLTALRVEFDSESQTLRVVWIARTGIPHGEESYTVLIPRQRALKQGPQLLWSRDALRTPARDKGGSFIRCAPVFWSFPNSVRSPPFPSLACLGRRLACSARKTCQQ
jgi:hypothetical protein